jgi:predicted RNase H-like HicB family nuclease
MGALSSCPAIEAISALARSGRFVEVRAGNIRRSGERKAGMKNYIAIAEPSDDGKSWWISFPGFPGVTSAADSVGEIVGQAQDALTSAAEAGATMPAAIEDGAIPSYDLSEYRDPLVLLVPLAMPAVADSE